MKYGITYDLVYKNYIRYEIVCGHYLYPFHQDLNPFINNYKA